MLEKTDSTFNTKFIMNISIFVKKYFTGVFWASLSKVSIGLINVLVLNGDMPFLEPMLL